MMRGGGKGGGILSSRARGIGIASEGRDCGGGRWIDSGERWGAAASYTRIRGVDAVAAIGESVMSDGMEGCNPGKR
jgi:hypothetical protein